MFLARIVIFWIFCVLPTLSLVSVGQIDEIQDDGAWELVESASQMAVDTDIGSDVEDPDEDDVSSWTAEPSPSPALNRRLVTMEIQVEAQQLLKDKRKKRPPRMI